MYSYSVCCFSRQMLWTIKYDLVNIMGWDNHFKLSLSWIGLLNLGHVIFLFGSWKGITLGTLQFCWDTQHPRWKGQNALHPININRATLILSSCASSCYSNSAVPPQCFFQDLFQIYHVLGYALGFDNHVVNVDLDISFDLLLEHSVHQSLVCSACIF